MAKLTKVPGKTRPVEVNGQVQQVQVYAREVTVSVEIDIETLKQQKADLEAQLADINAQIAGIQAGG